MLAPLHGKPVIAHIISRAAEIVPKSRITVTTSEAESDDPLACYVQSLAIAVHRGSLENVFQRFQSCLKEFPCDWFFRICADSPLLDSKLLKSMLVHTDEPSVDLVTNVQIRTFPKGKSAELLNAATFAGIDGSKLSSDEKEHVTSVYYRNPEHFKIINIESSDPNGATRSFAVDTLVDLSRLEKFLSEELQPPLKTP